MKLLVFLCSILKKKQDTAGDWTLSWQSQECHHRSLLLFCCCCKGKSKTWRNKPEVCSSRKRKPLRTWLLHYPVSARGSRCHEAETRRQTTGFPHPQHYPRYYIGIDWFLDILSSILIATIPASPVILKAVFLCNRQDSWVKRTVNAFSLCLQL